MNVLIMATIEKKNAEGKISAIAERFGEISLLFDRSVPGFFMDQEWRFTMNGIVGKFRIFQDCPEIHFGKARFHMLFENTSRNQFEEIDLIVQELFTDTEHPMVKVIMKESVEDLYLSRVLKLAFIDMLGLNLRNCSGLAISNERMEFEIIDGFQMNNLIYGKISCQLEEKSILELNEELEHVLKSILALQEKRTKTKKTKVIPRLNESDLCWWNVDGTIEGGTTCYSEQGGIKHHIAKASTGFKTLNFKLSNFFQDSFLDIFGDVTMINLEKEKGGRRYSLFVGNFSGLEPIHAKVTIRQNLGTEKEYSTDVEPEIIRLINVIYDFLIKGINIQETFVEYIRNNANEICICGKKLEESLNEDIVEIGCNDDKKHLIHKSCWIKWKKNHKPREFNWYESYCPICDSDCSVYSVPWTDKRLVWKHIGP